MTAHCDFPACKEKPEPNGMCHDHRAVRVSGSFVKDRHDATSGGEH